MRNFNPSCINPQHSRLFTHAEISEETNLSALLINLWNLASKHKTGFDKLLVSDQCSLHQIYVYKVLAAMSGTQLLFMA